MSKKFNISLLEKGDIVFFQGNDFIAKRIIESQNIYTLEKYKQKSQWSHIGFVGEDGNFYESTVKINISPQKIKFLGGQIKLPLLQYVYGIYISSLEERFKDVEKEYNKIGIQRFYCRENYLKNEIIKKITNYGKIQYLKGTKYGGIELFGTLFTLIKYKLAKGEKEKEKILKNKNPFDTSAVYCVAFVSDSFKNGANVNYTDPKINTSVLVVDEAWLRPFPTENNIIKEVIRETFSF